MLLVLIAFALGALLWARLAAGYPPPRRRYRRLGRGEAAFLDAAAEAIFPPGGELGWSGRDADLPDYLDQHLEASPPRIRALVHALCLLLEHATLIFPAPGAGGRRRFSSLRPVQQAAVLEAWSESGIFFRRLAFTSLRALITLGTLSHPPLLRALRLAPMAIEPPIHEVDLWYPPPGRSRAEIAWTREDLSPESDGVPVDLEGPVHPAYAGERR